MVSSISGTGVGSQTTVPLSVLIVDTDRNARAAAAQIVSDAGFVVTMVASFEEASDRLARAAPDLLIADIRLGPYNGLQLILRSRAESAKIATIVTHVVRDPVLEAEAIASNAIYLVKPLDREELLTSIGKLLGEGHA